MVNNPQRGPRQDDRVPEEITRIIKEISSLSSMERFDAERLVAAADRLGDFLANQIRLKTNQIRKFLDAVTKISSERFDREDGDDYVRQEAILLRPKLAYSAGRIQEVKPLMTVLDPCLSRIKSAKDFDRFHRFVEAIIAYHRYYGGKES
ncbi:MAG: type III-A CRISPR-associated protein Csm2 [Chloroflexi bacterium]|nr:type III-A CRISPR-associated protein Csm2 [Chloroflexota bacterium]